MILFKLEEGEEGRVKGLVVRVRCVTSVESVIGVFKNDSSLSSPSSSFLS